MSATEARLREAAEALVSAFHGNSVIDPGSEFAAMIEALRVALADDGLHPDNDRWTPDDEHESIHGAALPDDGREGLDVERLARAMCEDAGTFARSSDCPWIAEHREDAQKLAAEYDRLIPADKP